MVPEPIDVVVCTWNSESHLAECLRAVRANLPVATLWVIDRFSTDGTLAICEAFGCRVVQEDCNLGLARKLGIDCVTTDVFAFVDSDYVVCDGWFEKMSVYWNATTGMASGGHAIVSDVAEYERYRNANRPTRVEIVPIGRGGGTENTLIRCALVKNMTMPHDIGGREDWVIAEHVKTQGYDVAHFPVESTHYAANPYKQALWAGGGARRLQKLRMGFTFPLLRSVAGLVIESSQWLLRKRDPQVALMLLRVAGCYLIGYVTNNGYRRT